MDRDRSWFLVFLVAGAVLLVSLGQSWQAMRDPVPALTELQRHQLYESNFRNFTESCAARAGVTDNPGLMTFCRRQAELLRLLSGCKAECQQRTASFTQSEPTK